MKAGFAVPTAPHAPFWTPANLAAIAAGRWLVEPGDAAATLTGVGIDTRTIRPGQVYVAIRGERFDGNAFVPQAAATGAAMAIVDRDLQSEISHLKLPVLLVDDSTAALQQFARAYRDALRAAGCRVIAITGSNGKTTTRNLIHTMLSAKFRGTQSPKSFNNHLGVPLTLLGADLNDDFVVVEIGSNHPGEVAQLAAIVRPDAAVVTSIGHEHMEFFGTLKNVAKEELSILQYVASDGIAAVVDDVDYWPKGVTIGTPQGVRLVRFGGAPTCDVRIGPSFETLPSGGLRFTVSGPFDQSTRQPDMQVELPLLGTHNASNATAAVTIGRWAGLQDQEIAAALTTTKPVPGRLETLRFGSVTVINDAYNANPTSMTAAISQIAGPRNERRVVILGDMFELGDLAPEAHRDIGRYLCQFRPNKEPGDPKTIGGFQVVNEELQITQAIFIGRLSLYMAEVVARQWPAGSFEVFPQWSDDLPEKVVALLKPGDLVLLKGSRGMKLERLLPAIEKRFA